MTDDEDIVSYRLILDALVGGHIHAVFINEKLTDKRIVVGFKRAVKEGKIELKPGDDPTFLEFRRKE